MQAKRLHEAIKKLPNLPGVYIFKDTEGTIIYVGKANNLKKRVSSYPLLQEKDIRVETIMAAAASLEYIVTKSELEAMILEAQLIQAHQPQCNVLLKTGQPFLYLVITSSPEPELKVVRNKRQKGSYFGPFIEKTAARRVYDFLIKTFKLKRCGKKIANGCLYYHMGICSGSCRPDFDAQGYKERLELARASLQKGHAAFLEHLKQEMLKQSSARNFEKAKHLHEYYKSFQHVYAALEAKATSSDYLTHRDIWILTEGKQFLYVFEEHNTSLKKKHLFTAPLVHDDKQEPWWFDCFLSYYRTYSPHAKVLVNFDLEDSSLYESFLKQWHNLKYNISIEQPLKGHQASLVRLTTIKAQQESHRQQSTATALMRLLNLPIPPKTIDCFDISHLQGQAMVGACIRFTDGKPDPAKFRHFHIKTLTGQDDYAALREIVLRRYKDPSELPDLMLIDGGKGQLNAIKKLFPQTACASLAKKEEIVYATTLPEGKKLSVSTATGQLLIALRDYTHHFAISFHRKQRSLLHEKDC